MLPAALSDHQRAEIITRCEEHERNESRNPGFRRCVVLGRYYIKYGPQDCLEPEYKTQHYIYEKSVGDTSAPRIPQVHDYFTEYFNLRYKMAYLVMEYIDASPSPARNAPKEVAEALQWLRRLPAPCDVAIGSIGGGAARHGLFQDFEAPLLFSGKEALERYMNKALEWIPRGCEPKNISFSDEWPVFTQSDMDESNFRFDTNRNICIVNFEAVGLLPQSFASWTMHRTTDPFVSEVAKYLNWSVSPNLPSMRRAGEILQMSADETLGLDEDGWLNARC